MYVTSQKDFYKTDHRRQYPEGTQMVYSNLTPRSSRLFPWAEFDGKIVWFGLQAWIKDFLMKEWQEGFFDKPKEEVVGRYKRRLDTSLGPDAVPVEHIGELHDLGYLPIEIKSLPEGSLVNIGIPCLTIHNTDDRFFWLTNDLETVMSADLWKPTTVATIAYQYKKMLTKYAEETGGDLNFVALQGHDFSFRGMSGRHDAGMSGMGHLTSFVGTDTIPAIDNVERFYNGNSENELIGCSVAATEHSVMCMGGMDNEHETFRRLIQDIYPSGIVSIVSDTWDLWNVVRPKTGILAQHKDIILNRKEDALGLAKVVVRPDSGDPVKIICGLHVDKGDQQLSIADVEIISGKYYNVYTGNEVNTEEVKGVVECLWEEFGGTINEKGYKVLNPRVGVIYGDSITLDRANAILEGLKAKGFCSTNIVFGIGSYTYQYITRDTFGFAVKATAGKIKDSYVSIQKDPITDGGTKKSAKGFLVVNETNSGFELKQDVSLFEIDQGALQTVFKDGKLLVDEDFQTIRGRLNNKIIEE